MVVRVVGALEVLQVTWVLRQFGLKLPLTDRHDEHGNSRHDADRKDGSANCSEPNLP